MCVFLFFADRLRYINRTFKTFTWILQLLYAQISILDSITKLHRLLFIAFVIKRFTMINELNAEIQNFINSNNDWMRKTYEVDEAKNYKDFLIIVKAFIDKIDTPKGHKKHVEMDRCLFEAINSRISIDFKFINQNKSVTSIDGMFTVNVL